MMLYKLKSFQLC